MGGWIMERTRIFRRFGSGRSWLAALALLSATPGIGLALGPAVTSATLANGARLVVSEQRTVPMVLVQVIIDAGARRDPADRAGLAYLAADLLNEGTTTRSAEQINEAIDFLGASLSTSAEMDYAAIGLRVLKKDLDAGLDLLADVVLRPAFAEAELARRREAVLASIRASQDSPTMVAVRAFRPALFGDEPYGHPVDGTEATVARITRSDIQKFYRGFYRPAGALVVVVGDIAAEDAKARVEKALANWGGTAASAFRYTEGPPTGAGTVRIDKPITQAAVILGHRGVARSNPDYEALTAMNYILGGGGFSSRLMDSIRTQAGLVYGVYSAFGVTQARGGFQIVMQTKNQSVNEAIARARAEVDRIRIEPVSDGELDEAKRYLTGSYPLKMDSNGEIAQLLVEFSLFDLGFDYVDTYVRRINALTKEDIQRVAQEYLHPESFVEVIVGDQSAIARK